MTLDDRAAARLEQIGRRLAREEPELAEALLRWGPPRRRPSRRSWLILVVGLLCCVLALVLGSPAWFVLVVLTTGSGWCIARGLESESRPARLD